MLNKIRKITSGQMFKLTNIKSDLCFYASPIANTGQFAQLLTYLALDDIDREAITAYSLPCADFATFA